MLVFLEILQSFMVFTLFFFCMQYMDVGEDTLVPDDFTAREMQTGMWWYVNLGILLFLWFLDKFLEFFI